MCTRVFQIGHHLRWFLSCLFSFHQFCQFIWPFSHVAKCKEHNMVCTPCAAVLHNTCANNTHSLGVLPMELILQRRKSLATWITNASRPWLPFIYNVFTLWIKRQYVFVTTRLECLKLLRAIICVQPLEDYRRFRTKNSSISLHVLKANKLEIRQGSTTNQRDIKTEKQTNGTHSLCQ